MLNDSPAADLTNYMNETAAEADVSISSIDYDENLFIIDLNGDEGDEPNYVYVRAERYNPSEVFPDYTVFNGHESVRFEWEQDAEFADLLMRLKDGGNMSD